MRVTKSEKDGVQIYRFYVKEGECLEVQLVDDATGKLLQTSVAYDSTQYTQEDVERFIIPRKEIEKHGTDDVACKCHSGALYGDCARQA